MLLESDQPLDVLVLEKELILEEDRRISGINGTDISLRIYVFSHSWHVVSPRFCW